MTAACVQAISRFFEVAKSFHRLSQNSCHLEQSPSLHPPAAANTCLIDGFWSSTLQTGLECLQQVSGGWNRCRGGASRPDSPWQAEQHRSSRDATQVCCACQLARQQQHQRRELNNCMLPAHTMYSPVDVAGPLWAQALLTASSSSKGRMVLLRASLWTLAIVTSAMPQSSLQTPHVL